MVVIKNFKKKSTKKETKLEQGKLNLPQKTPSEVSEKKQETDGRKTLPQLFKKGQSGNPLGRPKGTLGWRNQILKAAEEEKEFMEKHSGNVIKKTKLQIIAEKLVEKAAQGDMRAIEEFGNRIEGKAHQSINVDGEMSVTERLIILPGRKEKND